MQLYHYFRSSASYRVRIALNLKGLAHEKTQIHLLKQGGEQLQPEFRAINPDGLVPALVDDGQIINQSLAIIEYLDETHPQVPLLPASALNRAYVRAIALSIACDIHPINNLRILNYLKDQLGQNQEAVDSWYRHWIEAGFTTLEKLLPDTPFAGGNAPNLVDACLVPQMYNARRFKTDLTPFPKVVAMADRAGALPAFLEAAPPLN